MLVRGGIAPDGEEGAKPGGGGGNVTPGTPGEATPGPISGTTGRGPRVIVVNGARATRTRTVGGPGLS